MVTDSTYSTSYRGLSTDTKPKAKDGDDFYEYDSKKWYVYNGTTETWVEQ